MVMVRECVCIVWSASVLFGGCELLCSMFYVLVAISSIDIIVRITITLALSRFVRIRYGSICARANMRTSSVAEVGVCYFAPNNPR